MATEPLLERRLAALRRRVRLLVAEQWSLTWGAGAAALGLVWVALDKFRLLRLEWYDLVALLAAAAVAGFAFGFLRRLDDFDVARAAEHRLSLKERLSSAVALESRSAEDPMVAALVEDAAGHLGPVQPARLFPRRFDRCGQAFLGLIIVLAAAVILPELPAFQSPATRRDRAALRRQSEELVKLASDLEKRRLPQDSRKILRQVALNLKALGKEMKTARVTRKQALVRLNKIDQQLRLAQSQMGPAKPAKSLAQAALEMKAGQQALVQSWQARQAKILDQVKAARLKAGQGPPGKQLTEEQIKALEKLAQSLKASQAQQLLNLDADLASKIAELLAKGDTQEALKILKKLADKLGDPGTLKKLTPEQLKQLAEELRQLAEALKGTDLDKLAKDMLELAKALERGDLKLAQNCANKAGGT